MSRSRTQGEEVQGRALDAVVTAVASLAPATRMRVQTILADRDVLHVAPGEWYHLEDYLDALDDVESAIGPSVLRRIGMQVPVITNRVESGDDPESTIAELDAAYRSAHRGSQVGGFSFERKDESAGTVISTTPYPDHFDRGILDATFSDGRTSDIFVRVTPASGFGDPDQDTRYDIHW